MSEAKILETPTINQPETILREGLYGQNENTVTPIQESLVQESLAVAPEPIKKPKAKPTHYKVVCISLYTQDIENLEAKVAELKRRGHTKANKSQLIRQALRMLDIDKLPPPQQ